MWYMIDLDNGVIDTASTRISLLTHNGPDKVRVLGHQCGKPVYHVLWDKDDGIGDDAYIYSSKEQAVADGFDWAFAEDGVG